MLVVNTPKRLPNSVFPPSAVNASPLNYSSDRKKTFETVEFLVIRSMACLVSQVMSLKVQFVRLLLVESHSQLKFAFKLSQSLLGRFGQNVFQTFIGRKSLCRLPSGWWDGGNRVWRWGNLLLWIDGMLIQWIGMGLLLLSHKIRNEPFFFSKLRN